MTRLASAVRWDIRLQIRQGFYYAAAFVAILSILVLSQLPDDVYTFLLPVFVLGNMTVNTFYFVSGLVLLEKDEGVLEGLVVTPLRQAEYLGSKCLSLATLTLIENTLIVLLVYGLGANWILLIAGVLMTSFINILYGFIAVARYDSINAFLLPSIIWTLVLSLPLLDYFGILSTPLMYLHPIQASLTLLKGAFQPIPAWQLLYGLLYSALWVCILFIVSRRAFYRFIILGRGVRT